MKKNILAYALGIATAATVVLAAMWTGTPFRSMPIKYGLEDGFGIISTERFVVVYEGMKGDAAGSTNFTYAGKVGTLQAFWRGYGTGWSGRENGIDFLMTYEPGFGAATLYFFGKLLRVEDDGHYLRVQDQRLPLGKEKIAVVVDKGGSCRELSGPDADRLVHALPAWYRDPRSNAGPPTVAAAAR